MYSLSYAGCCLPTHPRHLLRLTCLCRLRVQGDQAYSVVSTSDDSEEENVVDYNGNADDTFASRHHHLIGEPPCSIRDILM